MKKFMMELAVVFLAVFMLCAVGLLAEGLQLAAAGIGLELVCGSAVVMLYREILREERRAARKARCAARAAALRCAAAQPACAADGLSVA